MSDLVLSPFMKKLFIQPKRVERFVAQIFQTSKRIFRGSCFIAFILSLLILPVWYQVFNSNIPVSLSMAAPGVEYVRAYWDDPTDHPDAYERIAIKPSQTSKTWNIQIEALGERNPQAKGSQVWVLDIDASQQRLNWSDASLKAQSWEFRNDSWLPGGKALLANRGTLQKLSVPIEGGDLTIKLVRSDYCGKARLTVNGEVREIDLYSPIFAVEELKFRAVEPGDTTVRTYQLNHIQATPWQKLILTPEDHGQAKFEQMIVQGQQIVVPQDLDKIKVEQITVQGLQFQAKALQFPGNSAFFLPSQLWHRKILAALISTIISFFWMTGLLISAVHLWFGQRQVRFGIRSYISGLAIALGGFWTLVFYPAHMTMDTLSQWQQALMNHYITWAAPLTAMLMWMTRLFTDEPNLFCFLQGSLFWFAILYLVSQVIQNNKLFLISTSFLILLPTLWIYPATIVTNVNFTSFSLLAASFLVRAFRESKKQLLWVSIVPLSLAVASRNEAIFMALAPILLAQLPRWSQPKLMRRVIEGFLMILLVFSPAKLLERLPVVTNNTPVGFAFINQYVGTVSHARSTMSAIELEGERSSIDSQFGTGTFNTLLQRYQCDAANYIVWKEPIIISVPRVQQSTPFILRKTLELAIKHPLAYIQHKFCNLAYVLQVPDVFYFYAIPYDAFGINKDLKAAGITVASKFPSWRDQTLSYVVTLSKQLPWSILFRHHIFLVISLILLIFGAVFQKAVVTIPAIMGLLSFCGLLIPDAFPDWRHLLLMHICTWIALLGLLDCFLLNRSSRQHEI